MIRTVLLSSCSLRLLIARAQPIASDTAENLRLTQYRQQHRRTEDGRLCAAAFVQNKQRFTDCTVTLAPDRSTSGSEWCYVEAQYNKAGGNGTEPAWGFCRPVIDYDYIRAAATQSLTTRIEEVTRLSAKLAADKAKIDDVIERYERVCNRELNETEARVAEMEKLIQHGLHALDGAEDASAAIIALDAALEEMSASAEEEFVRALSQPENCRAVRGYEDESESDGLRGIYYPSPTFTCAGGSKQVRIDPIINFAWTGRQPAPSIPAEAFSVRWDGFLLAPESAEYRLHLETACAGRVFLNRKIIIKDRMPDTPYEENAGLTDHEIPLLSPSGISGVRKVSSNALMLTGGKKVPIRIEMAHSAHLLWQNEDTSIIKLSWSSQRIPEQPIPSDFLFSSNPSPVLKLSRLAAASTDVQFLTVGLEPFPDDATTFIGDLPPELDNAKIVRMSKAYQGNLVLAGQSSDDSASDPTVLSSDFFEFAINVPSQMFVAYMHRPPLEVCIGRNVQFKRYSKDAVIGLYVYAGKQKLPHATMQRASYVDYYKIDMAVLSTAGGYRFAVKDSPFLVFFKALPASTTGCDGGEVICISDPSDPNSAYEACSASSTAGDAYSCEYGLSRLNADQRYSTWKSEASRGLGEYLEITFRETVRPTGFTFKPLDDPLAWPSELTVYFEPGGSHSVEPQKFNLIYSSDIQLLKYTLVPESTRYLRFEVTGMYATGQSTGGSIEVMGTVCNDVEVLAAASAMAKEITSYAVDDCAMMVSDLPDVPVLRTNLVIDVDCPATCPVETETVPKVFGTSVYSIDSAVCLAAIHAGVCPAQGGTDVCRSTLLLVAGAQRYTGSDRYGVISGLHGPADLSFVIQPRTSDTAQSVVTAAGSRDMLGSRIIVFDASSNSPSTAAMPGDVAIDIGAPFAPHQEVKFPEFGWLRQAEPANCDAQSNADDSDQVDVKGGVSFPPGDGNSPLCTGGVDCTENYWSIKLEPKASYDIVIQVGHPCKPEADETYRYDMSANNVQVVTNKQLKAGEAYYGTVRNVKADDKGMMRLQSKCSGDCKTSLTTILQLKIDKANKIGL